jgi:hypothetical protein
VPSQVARNRGDRVDVSVHHVIPPEDEPAAAPRTHWTVWLCE